MLTPGQSRNAAKLGPLAFFSYFFAIILPPLGFALSMIGYRKEKDNPSSKEKNLPIIYIIGMIVAVLCSIVWLWILLFRFAR